MTIGTKLKTLRLQKGVSVYKLAQLCDISENHIHRIEKDLSCPSIPVLESLLSALGVSLSEFFNNNAEQMYPSQSERRLLAYFRAMAPDAADVFLQMGEVLSHR